MKVDQISCQIIKNSRNQPTIEVVLTAGQNQAKASVPSGKSRGNFEAALVDPDQARQIIGEITPQLITKNFSSQEEWDNFLISLDGTVNKSKLGSNVILALSIAFARLSAQLSDLPLFKYLSEIADLQLGFPKLFLNLINGGLHVSAPLNPLPFQEYLIIPQIGSPAQSLQLAGEFLENLKRLVFVRNQQPEFGDEGGFVISGDNPELGLEILEEARLLGDFGDQIEFGLDVAASSLSTFLSDQGMCYQLKSNCLTVTELMNLYLHLRNKYPLMSIEDPFGENDLENWSRLMTSIGKETWLVGDDLTVTNTKRIEMTFQAQAANAIIIKPNQIGTVTETLAAIKLARSYGWKIIVSHRSGETEDSFIADLAFGVGADGLKAGSPLQQERIVKYNRLVEIEKSLS